MRRDDGAIEQKSPLVGQKWRHWIQSPDNLGDRFGFHDRGSQ